MGACDTYSASKMFKRNQVWEIRPRLKYKWNNIPAQNQGCTSALQYAKRAFKIQSLDQKYIYISWIKLDSYVYLKQYDITLFIGFKWRNTISLYRKAKISSG